MKGRALPILLLLPVSLCATSLESSHFDSIWHRNTSYINLLQDKNIPYLNDTYIPVVPAELPTFIAFEIIREFLDGYFACGIQTSIKSRGSIVFIICNTED